MSLLQATYPIAPKGLATNYEETSLPPDFALKFRNRFINTAGGAEKRRGLTQLGPTIGGSPSVTALHELVDARTGATTLLASGEGRIYRFSVTASTWTTAHDSGFRGVTYQSAQMVDRLLFVNGTSRNVYTKDGLTFSELQAIITEGLSTGSTSAVGLYDSTTSANGFFGLGAAPDDILINLTRSRIAAITSVSAGVAVSSDVSAPNRGGLVHTRISAQTAGDRYRVIDTTELNIIPTSGDPDNVATMTAGTNTNTVFVSGINWPGSELRIGDWFINTTRNAVLEVTAFSSASVLVATFDATAANFSASGDSFTLHKSAMPVATRVHIHYGRAYFVDARDQHLIRISGPDDPTDMTTSTGTIESGTFSFGSQQPTGDIIKAMTSFQRFLVMVGNRFTLMFNGTDPIKDAAGDEKDFSPTGLFPQGARSANGLATIGNDVVIISDDGVQSFALRNDASTLNQENLSEALRNQMRDLIATTAEADIFIFHYPRRSWVCFKIGSQIYVYNYSPYFGQSTFQPGVAFTPEVTRGSWSLFDGVFAQQRCFMTRQDGTLVCGGDGGKVYTFDASNSYSDAGTAYVTEYQSGWLTLDEPRRSLQIKQGHYIQPTFNAGAEIPYTITAESPFQIESRDTVTVTANAPGTIGIAVVGTWVIGQSSIFDRKFPLRWRGKEMRLSITTQDTSGPDVISRFTLYVNRFGVR